MTELERRYERLLRLYPAAYRQARGAEMLAVLMDVAPPDRRRPEWREVRGLVIGALRARAGADGRRTAWQSWRVALRMAALMLLIETAGDTLWQRTFNQEGAILPGTLVGLSLAVVATSLLAIVMIFRGAYLTAAVVTVGAYLLEAAFPHIASYTVLQWPNETVLYMGPSWWRLPFVVLLLIPLIRRRTVVVPKVLNLMLLIPVVSVAMDAYGTISSHGSFQTGSRAVWQTLAVAAVLWSVIDERLAMSFGIAFFDVVIGRGSALLMETEWSLWRWTLLDMAVLAILPLLDIAVGATVAARRARI